MLTYEEVLITVLLLSKDSTDQAARSADVAHLMCVTKAAMHNRVAKLIERGLIVKDARKKLRFTPAGLAYTTSLAKDVAKLQSFYARGGELSQEEAKNCAFALISTLPEDSRNRLIRSMDNRAIGSVDLYESTGLTVDTVNALIDRKYMVTFCDDNEERTALLNKTLTDADFYALLDEIAALRKEWRSVQAETWMETQNGRPDSSAAQSDGFPDEAKRAATERANFLQWRYSQSIERYCHRKIDRING